NARLILYIEDSTDEQLKNYRPFNSDFITMYFESEDVGSYFIFAERNGNSCLFPFEKYSQFWAGTYSGCDGGAVEVKETDKGFALYVKFFMDIPKPTASEPYLMYFDYFDITESDKDGILIKNEQYHFPDLWSAGKAIPITNVESKSIKVNSGKMTVNDFLFKPIDVLTEDLQKNSFACADDTVNVSTKQNVYSIDDVVNVDVVVNSDVEGERLKLSLYDMNDNLLEEKFSKSSAVGKSSFLLDLNKIIGSQEFMNKIFKVEVEFGIDGPKDFTYFAIGDYVQIPEKTDECYFYLTYDKPSKSASFLIHVDDPSNTGYDQVQIFVDKQGDSKKSLDENDISYSIDTYNIGAHEYSSDGGWKTNVEHNGEGRILQSKDGYDAFIHIDNVSENFRFAIEQIDHTGFDLKSIRIPDNGFSTTPKFWSDTEMFGDKPIVLKADKYQPNEIVATQSLDVNLILVGDEWTSELEQKIKQNLNSKYSPFILSELNRAGITYNYNFNFVSISQSESDSLFDYVKSESKPWGNTFYGESDFDQPWGFGPWIQANHTEWIKNNIYDVDFKTMDAEKMEEYIQTNIISSNNQFTKPTSVNLVFLSGDMDDIDFLHTYDLKRKDPSTNRYHEATGMMGFGGKYNFYFFDLYAVPWEDSQGWYDYDLKDDYGYDRHWNNDMINLHDIHTIERHAQLISDYVNNSTSMIITPSYLYGPTYKSNYILDVVLVADGGFVDIPSLTDNYFDENKIKEQLQELAPYSEWTVNLSVYDVNDREFSKATKEAIQSKTTIPVFEGFPEFGTVGIIDSDKLKKALTEWATTRTSSKFKDFKDVKESTWTIPVVVIVSNSKDQIYVDNYGTVGLAPAHPDDPKQPCCSIGITTDYNVFTKKSSVTDLVLHEVGHTLSFMHPFMGFDNDGEFKTYDYFEKWYWGVMGYNEPTQGCGTWYDYLVDYEDERGCGIADTFFTQFDKDNYSKGVTVYLIKTAKINVYNSMVAMEKSGQDIDDLPITTKNSITKIESLVKEANSKLKVNDLQSKTGAIQTALEAAILSSELAQKENISYNTNDNSAVELEIPAWVKNNAEWWGNDAITQSEFMQTIEYLIKQKILIIPDLATSETETSASSVPEWVKNNAKWWAAGQIDDEAFVSGIQYLIKNGVITV
ncbi:MAG: hypothetical protein H8D35_05870, partial [Nitrosopumilus sp.]|nr:hypothetical protein [Nitrosopumilus sp.]